MAYSAEISRNNPSCFLFLVDQSGSMGDVFPSDGSTKPKAQGVADATNRILQTLVIKCAKEEGVRDYFHVAVIGYGATVGSAFGGALAGRDLVPISEIANQPARLEERKKKTDDGAGGLVEQTVRFPIWFDPLANGATPMCQALGQAGALLQTWVAQHPNTFPPVVINITDGEATDGDPSAAADSLRRIATADGEVLLFNLHTSSALGAPIEFPDTETNLPDQFARLLFGMSSVLPPHIRAAAASDGIRVSDGTRGFVFNASLESVVKFLDIGTRPANLR